MTPTSRTLEFMRGLGYECTVTEHWNSFTHQRKDLLGFGDILAYNSRETILVQATSRDNMNARIKKIIAIPQAFSWLGCPARGIIVIGWKKHKEAIDRKYWRPLLAIIDVSGNINWIDPSKPKEESTIDDANTEQGSGEAAVSPVPSEE